jgi:hypothetical protein
VTNFDSAILTLLAGVVFCLGAGILIPGYALLLVAHESALKLKTRFPWLADAGTWFPTSGIDAFAFSLLYGMLWGAVGTTALARCHVSLDRVGFGVFGVGALISLVLIVTLLKRHQVRSCQVLPAGEKSAGAMNRGRSSAVASSGEAQPETAARTTKAPRQFVEIAVFSALILAFFVRLYFDFRSSPIIWDVPDLGLIQRAYWGDYPNYAFRGGWVYPGLIMLSGVFEPGRFPLLNSGVAAGWLCVVLLLTGIVYLAPRGRRVVWTGLFTVLLIGCRFTDFLLNTKYSVLGVALFVLFLGLIRRHLETGETRYAILAATSLGVGYAAGQVGLFYAIFSVFFLFLLCGERMLPVTTGTLVWIVLVTAAGTIHWSLGLLMVPVAVAALTVSVSVCNQRVVRGPAAPGGALATALILFAIAATLFATSEQGYKGYWWYTDNRLVDLYWKGYGVYLVFLAVFAVYAAVKKRLEAKKAVVLSMCFTAVIVPVAIINTAGWIRLPDSIPGIIFYEIGRVTSLYFAPLTICIAGAAMLTEMFVWLCRRHVLLGYAGLCVIIALLYAPTSLYPDEGLGGWERVAFRPLVRVWGVTLDRMAQSTGMAREAGDPAGYSPYFFNFSANELRMSRDLAQFGGPSNHCLFVLMRGSAPRQDPPAQGFFEWAIMNHLYPYCRNAPAASALAEDSTCVGRRTVLVHKSDYDLAGELPGSLKLRRELPNFRIFSETQ